MSKNKNKKTSLKQTFRVNWRAFLLLYRKFPQAMRSRLCYIAWTSLTPYAEVYLAALVIDELAGQKDPQRLLQLVLSVLLVGAITMLGTALLDKWKQTHNAGLWEKTCHLYAEKFLEMDYCDVDDTATNELYARIVEAQAGGAWGLFKLFENIEMLFGAVFSFFGGISLTVSLFTSRIPEAAKQFAFLEHPLFLIGLIALMFLITYLSPVFYVKAWSRFTDNSEAHLFTNRQFIHYSLRITNKALATDMRIYEQHKLYRYFLDKQGAFGSKGMFSKIARGPMGMNLAASAAVSCVFTGVVYLYVCLKAWAGAFGIGAVTQYIAAITKVAKGVSDFFKAIGDIKNNAVFLEQIFSLLDIPNKMYQGSLTVEKRRDRKYEVEFRNVSFQYPGSESYALKNVNVKFEIGKRLAVVGQNGSGKTTFIKLLCRLYDPTEGEILLNGIDIRKYNYAEYMAIFSIVFQDFKLLSLKLGENVACKVEYDRQKAKKCLQLAGFSERLKTMEQGLDTYLYKALREEGVDISGGEAQKIAIARAIYKDAPFIVLDEPTAALDPIAEAEIYEKFNEIAGDKTAIYISHRLSSCKFCDEIMVFDAGSVVQKGSHPTLLNDADGKYHALWHAQAQYYTE